MHRYNNNINLRKPTKAEVWRGNIFEVIFYETKPVLLATIAIIAYKHNYSNTGMAKLSIMVLLATAAYIGYCRLVHRGYIK